LRGGRSEKCIILYSLPLEWFWNSFVSIKLLVGMQRFYANVVVSPQGIQVSWPAREILGIWYYIKVLAHELGHHYRWQHRGRRGGSGRHAHEEFVAEIHSHRFYRSFLKLLRERCGQGEKA
jgi:hypothetical protein